MSDLDGLEKRIDYVQTEVDNVKKDINTISIQVSNNDLLVKRSLETNEKLSVAIDTLKTTMLEMGQSLKEANKISIGLTETVQKLNDKITDVECRMQTIDEKSKVDIMTWVKNNWFSIVIGLGALIYAISQIVK